MNLIKTLGHGFAVAYHDVITFFKGVATKAPAIADAAATDIEKLGPLANVVIGAVDPALLPVARASEAILGEVFAAIHVAGAEATTAGVVVKIEGDLVAGVKDFVALLSGHPAVQVAQAAQASTQKTN